MSREFLNKLISRNNKIVSFDIETTNDLDSLTQEVNAFFKASATRKLGLTYLADIIYLSLYIPPEGDQEGFGTVFNFKELNTDTVQGFLYELFSKQNVTFVAHNAVFDLRHLCGHYNLPIPAKIWDTYAVEIAFADARPGSVMPGDKQFSLKGLMEFYQIPYDESYTLSKSMRNQIHLMGEEVARDYVLKDTQYTADIMIRQAKRIGKLMASKEFTNIGDIVKWESRATRVYAHIASNGIPIDKDYLRKLIAQCIDALAQLKLSMQKKVLEYLIQIMKEAFRYDDSVPEAVMFDDVLEQLNTLCQQPPKRGKKEKPTTAFGIASEHYVNICREFSPNKHTDQHLYWQSVGIVTPPYSQATTFLWTSGGNSGVRKPSFGKKALEWYEVRYGEAIHLYLEHRRIEKLLAKAIELDIHASRDGKVHSLISTTTVTGRTSSSQPNLQNLNMGDFSGVFVAEPGCVLLELDISNAETWMGAIMAADSKQIAALRSADFHSQMAQTYFPIQWKQHEEAGETDKLKKLRKASKAVTFGTAYGQGPRKLAMNPELAAVTQPTEEEIEEIKQAFRAQGPRVVEVHKEWPDNEKEQFNPYNSSDNEWEEEAQEESYEDFIPVANDNPFARYEGWVLPINPIENATEEDWLYAGRVRKAIEILQAKDSTYIDTTRAKQRFSEFAEKNRYVELWTGRRMYVGEPRKAWNGICQGGVGELTKRWIVLIYEEIIEKCAFTGAKIVDFVHDSVVFHVPVPYAEFVIKYASYLLAKAVETNPLDKSGVHWFKRTNPEGGFYTGFTHEENAFKWGLNVNRDYPFPIDLKWNTPTEDELNRLLEMVTDKEFQRTAFLASKFVVQEKDNGQLWQNGVSLSEYLEHLNTKYELYRNEQTLAELHMLQEKINV